MMCVACALQEIRQVEYSEKALIQAFERKAKPLAVSEARYNIRRQRREGEEVHDEVEDLIAREVEELQKGVAAIQVKRVHVVDNPDIIL